MQKVGLFECTKPCGNCPYRKDAPLRLWHKEEFEKLAASENEVIGKVYKCHKNNGSACIGWLIKQDENNFPSIALRMELTKQGVTRDYLDGLSSPAPMYDTVSQMIEANYPEINNK